VSGFRRVMCSVLTWIPVPVNRCGRLVREQFRTSRARCRANTTSSWLRDVKEATTAFVGDECDECDEFGDDDDDCDVAETDKPHHTKHRAFPDVSPASCQHRTQTRLLTMLVPSGARIHKCRRNQ